MIEKAIMRDKDNAVEIEGLRAEVARLKEELSKAKEQEAFYLKTRRAIIFMLEDMNKSSAAVTLAKKEWEETFNAITDPLFIHDSEMKIVLANSAYAKYAGGADFVGRPYYEIFPRMGSPFESCLHAVNGAKETNTVEEEDIEIPQFSRIFRGRQYPIKDASGGYSHSIHILHDVTRLKTAEQELKTEVSVTSGLLNLAEATTRTRDMDNLLVNAVEASARILRADACLSYLYDSASAVFSPQQSFGLSPAELPSFRSGVLEANTWFIKEALASEAASVIHAPFSRTQPAARSLLFLERAATLLVLPFARKGGASGIFIYLFAKKKELQEKDRRLISGIINQVSSAVEEARLFRESVEKAIDLSRRIETIKVMREIDSSILSTLETNEIIETVTMLLARLIACDRVTVFTADRTRGGFVFQAGFGIDLPKGWFCPFSETTTTEVLEGFHIQYAANLMEEKTLLPFEKRLADNGFLSHIRLPIMVKGAAMAVLSIGSKRPSAFTTDDISTLENLVSQIGVALENARLVSDLQELFLSTIKTLSKAIDAKSPWTMGHSERVTSIALTIAERLGFDKLQLKTLELAGLLHDIGKLATYETILDKPERLTDDELKLMKQHPGKGAEILDPIRQLGDVIPAIKHHHEYYDGTGYPDGLKGEEIPPMARILTVADTVDAMGADRPYRKGRPMEFIIAELKRCSGTQFDPRLVEVFLSTVRNETTQ